VRGRGKCGSPTSSTHSPRRNNPTPRGVPLDMAWSRLANSPCPGSDSSRRSRRCSASDAEGAGTGSGPERQMTPTRPTRTTSHHNSTPQRVMHPMNPSGPEGTR
jgi:hypothetical protein